MDGLADPPGWIGRGRAQRWTVAAPAADGTGAGEGGSPYLTLDGFTGPLDHLLTLARAQKIDLADISLTALIDQLTTALHQAPAATSLGEKGDWVVMAAWLVQLRTRLLLPADAPGQQEATAEADQLRGRLVALEEMQALAFWLEQRPQLGHDVFARGRPERVRRFRSRPGAAIDVIEFLWASLALFDDEEPPDTATAYRPAPLRLHTVAEARARILRRLKEQPDGARSISSCLTPQTRRTRTRPAVAPPLGLGAHLSPVWNWRSRARWCWGRGRISNPSMLHRLKFTGPDGGGGRAGGIRRLRERDVHAARAGTDWTDDTLCRRP